MNIKLKDLKTILFYSEVDLEKSTRLIDYYEERSRESDNSEFYKKQYKNNMIKIEKLKDAISSIKSDIDNFDVDVKK